MSYSSVNDAFSIKNASPSEEMTFISVQFKTLTRYAFEKVP